MQNSKVTKFFLLNPIIEKLRIQRHVHKDICSIYAKLLWVDNDKLILVACWYLVEFVKLKFETTVSIIIKKKKLWRFYEFLIPESCYIIALH